VGEWEIRFRDMIDFLLQTVKTYINVSNLGVSVCKLHTKILECFLATKNRVLRRLR